MFKKAIVLKVFGTNENYSVATVRKIIDEFGLENYECIPDFNDIDITLNIFSNILPKSVLCLTLNSDEERKVLICNPMSSSHLQIPVKVGELIWYFKDTTFSDDEIKNQGFLSINHYWHSRVSSNINNENASLTAIAQQELDVFSNVSQIDIDFNRLLAVNGIDTSEFIQTQTLYSDSLIFQDGNNNIISLNKNIDTAKINIISGFNLETNDIDTSLINDFSSAISLNESSTLNELMSINNFEDSLFLSFDKNQKFITNNNKNTLKTYEKDILTKLRESNTIENITNIVKKNDDKQKPNIVIKSEDINIISSLNDSEAFLEGFGDEDDDLFYPASNGKIELVRIGSINNNFNSKITIDEKNDIKIDGETIYIGNFIRNLANKNIISDDLLSSSDFDPSTFIENLTDFNVINDMCGKGDGVVLGYEKSLSEPLVLGNTLIAMLKDMIDLTNTVIDQNKSLIKEIKSMSDEYVNHTHPPVPTQIGPQPVNASLNVASHSGFGSKADNFDKKLTETKDRLNNINQNLKYALSRFSKTS